MKVFFSLIVAGLCAVSFGQFSDNFESLSASGTGTMISGQNGWYLAPVAGSVDGSVFTYSGNTPGFVNNASGGNNFAGGSSVSGTTPIRMQHAVTFANTGLWVMSVDFNFAFSGAPPVANNLGSVSLQPSTTNNAFQTLYAYDNNSLGNPTGYRALFGFAGATGGALVLQTAPTGPQWDNLVFNHWYRQTVTWDAAANQIVETTLTDMTAGGPTATFNPTDWFLSGGQNNVLAQALATDVRLFVSGGNANSTNFGGYDNFSIGPVPEPGTIAALSIGALALLRRRRKV